MSKPLILAIESEGRSLALIAQQLTKRYGADYEIFCSDSAERGLRALEELQKAEAEVVAVLAGCWLGELDGESFLQRARALHPEAKRALLIAQDDVEAAQVILRATALGTIDAFTGKPGAAAEEEFHYVMSGLLRGWAWEHRPTHLMAQIVGERWARRSHELRDLFQRNRLPYVFYDADSAEGRALVDDPSVPLPVVLLADGQVLSNPTNIELAKALDVSNVTDISGVPVGEVVDVVIVGAGNSAGQAAIHLAHYAQQVTMLVRGESLATSMSEYLIKEIESRENIRVRLQTQVVHGEGQYHLERLRLEDRQTGEQETVQAQALFVLIGATPHTEWLPESIKRDAAGFVVTGAELLENGKAPATWASQRAPLLLETSIPGVFAAGDVRHRSLKRVASAVGEGSIAITSIHQYLAQRQ